MSSSLLGNYVSGSTEDKIAISTFERQLNMREVDRNDLHALEEKLLVQQERLDMLCKSLEARDVVATEISSRLQTLEEAAVSHASKLPSDCVGVRGDKELDGAMAVDLLELRNDFRIQQDKQTQQAERLVSIVTDLEQLFLCTKQEPQKEPSECDWENKFNELQTWVNQEVQGLEAQFCDLRNSFDKCLPLGTLVREMQGNIVEHRHCHESFKDQIQKDLERLHQKMTAASEELVIRCCTLEYRVAACCKEKARNVQADPQRYLTALDETVMTPYGGNRIQSSRVC